MLLESLLGWRTRKIKLFPLSLNLLQHEMHANDKCATLLWYINEIMQTKLGLGGHIRGMRKSVSYDYGYRDGNLWGKYEDFWRKNIEFSI